jgi:hypothetical protein
MERFGTGAPYTRTYVRLLYALNFGEFSFHALQCIEPEADPRSLQGDLRATGERLKTPPTCQLVGSRPA